MSFAKLSFINDLSPLNIFLEIIPSDSGFVQTLERTNLSNDAIALTLNICAVIVSLPLYEHALCFAERISSSVYWKNILQLVSAIFPIISPPEDKVKKKKNVKPFVMSSDQCAGVAQNICTVYEALLQRQITIGDSIIDCILLHLRCGKFAKQMIAFEQKLNALRRSVPFAIADKNKQIYPKLSELLSTIETDASAPNVTHGRYKNVSAYLDTQLGLLREDFIRPLREGIREFIETRDPADIRSFRYYERVRITTPLEAGLLDGISNKQMIMLDLGRGPEKKYKPNGDLVDGGAAVAVKELLYGSLLLLTGHPIFDDLIVAVITNCDADLLSQGYVSKKNSFSETSQFNLQKIK